MANKLLVNLCLALLLVVVIFAAGISRAGYAPVCQAIAALLHFSLLAALMWMGAEAVNLYLTVVRLKVASSRRYFGLCMATCWGKLRSKFCQYCTGDWVNYCFRTSCTCCGVVLWYLFKRLWRIKIVRPVYE